MAVEKEAAVVGIIKQLIQEVKQENKGKILSEGLVKEEEAILVERKALKNYVASNLIDALRKSEK
jgi:glycerol-3-phosphate responsive antiterminator